MTNENKNFSDLSIERKECPKCGALWLNGQHYWSGTGNEGNEHDLAGLVCNKHGDETCINPCKGSNSGDTWGKRFDVLKQFKKDLDDQDSR